ncbi:integral membrane protein, putative [Glarea lozoyensis ATCC 20868]|uniref:Integral membrane protein, putative n=1 Tax=Glarea lozoyensis (strain ATCC 20868 / MF5171) TaxID=1116229 RepID=S3CWD2_GLAL2|nr:integral membrane protein, putative [Glarea lozoyensis ATCC 20868]EPE29945.1 integral membrane protein, putative [Glarea lozoyensis ATCC 20868]
MSTNTTRVPFIKPYPGHKAFDGGNELWKYAVFFLPFLFALSTVTLALRIYARAVIRKIWTLEDYAAIVCWIVYLAWSIVAGVIYWNKGGYHGWNLTKQDLKQILHWLNINTIIYSIAACLTKLTILSIYRTLFVTQRKSKFNIMLYAFEAILVIFYGAQTIAKCFECIPRERIWNPSVPGKCLDWDALLVSSGAFSWISDIVIFLIPIKRVWGLNMQRAERTRVIAIFSIGSIAPIFGGIGFIARQMISDKPDITFDYPLIMVWGTIEIAAGVIIVCLPSLSIYFRKNRPATDDVELTASGTGKRKPSRSEKSPNATHNGEPRAPEPIFVPPPTRVETTETSQRNSRLCENQKDHTIVTEGLTPWTKTEHPRAESDPAREGKITTICESSSETVRPKIGESPWPEKKSRISLDLERGDHGKEHQFGIFTSTTITQTVSEHGSV